MSANKAVAQLLDSLIVRKKTPGLQYAFFDSGNIIFEYQNGLAKISEQVKVTSATTFNCFSVTKTFTAVAILQLAEAGKLHLESTASSLLTGLPFSAEFTIRQLMAHTSGLANPLPLRWIHLASEHEGFDRDSFFKNIYRSHSRLKSMPGEKFSYSNLGYVILGQVIEKVSGMKYEQYIIENIFSKMGMEESDLSSVIPNPENHATGYHKILSLSYPLLGFLLDTKKYFGQSENGWKSLRPNYVNGTSYGGLIGNAKGFTSYLQELLKPESKLLPPEAKKLLFTAQKTANGKSTGSALSWFIGELNGNEYFCHAGGGGGYYCEIRLYPALQKGSVIIFNRSGMSDERFLSQLDSAFL